MQQGRVTNLTAAKSNTLSPPLGCRPSSPQRCGTTKAAWEQQTQQQQQQQHQHQHHQQQPQVQQNQLPLQLGQQPNVNTAQSRAAPMHNHTRSQQQQVSSPQQPGNNIDVTHSKVSGSAASNAVVATTAADGAAHQQQQQQQAGVQSSSWGRATVGGTQQQQQQHSSTNVSTAVGVVYEHAFFAAGQEVLLTEQTYQLYRNRGTTTTSNLSILGLLARGGNADAYLVRLVQHNRPAAPPQDATATAAASQGAAGSALQVPNTAATAFGASHTTTTRSCLTLQPGQQYVLKVARQFESYAAGERGTTALGAYLRGARTQLHNESQCHKQLAASLNVPRCFAYGKVAAAGGASAAAAAAGGGAAGIAAAVARQQAPTCLLLEYVEGGSLQQVLRPAPGQFRPLTVQQAWHVMTDVSRALMDCHAQGIVYRDLKPANILVSNAAGGTRTSYKLSDLGASLQLCGPCEFGSDHLDGTPSYRAPEQKQDSQHDARLDTFQYGLLLLELRTGMPPLPHLAGLPEQEQLARRCYAEVVACGLYTNVLSSTELALVESCLQAEVNMRPQIKTLRKTSPYLLGPPNTHGGMEQAAAHLQQAVQGVFGL